MKKIQRVLLALLLFVIVACGISCAEKKQGKVVITQHEFVLRQDKDHSYVVDARGKVKNVGDVDVKRIVVTGYCRSCSEVWTVGKWFVSGAEKTPDQKDIISYLPVGQEAEFSFAGVADIYYQGETPPEMPENMEVVIESFETVD